VGHDLARKSMELLAREVIPKLRQAHTPAAGAAG
jgi:hypothetical protein